MIGILGVGAALLVGLGGLILTIGGWLRGDIQALRRELRGELHALADRVTVLERGQERIEGMLEGAGLFRAAEPSEIAGD